MTRSVLIREVETDLHNARARGMLKQPKYAGRTYTEVKVERARRWRHIKQGLWVLSGVALVVALWVLR